MLSHKINFNTFKSIEIIQNMFPNKMSRKISQSKTINGNFYLSIKKNRFFFFFHKNDFVFTKWNILRLLRGSSEPNTEGRVRGLSIIRVRMPGSYSFGTSGIKHHWSHWCVLSSSLFFMPLLFTINFSPMI